MLQTRYIVKIKTKIKSTSVFLIGNDESSMLIDELTGMPVIPATSIAGAFRNYLVNADIDLQKIDSLFGNSAEEGSKSKLFIADAYGDANRQQSRTHIRIKPINGTADNGLRTVRYMDAGISFELYFRIEASSEEEKKEFLALMKICMKALQLGFIRLGAHKTNGAGIFVCEDLQFECLDLQDREQMKQYLLQEERWSALDLTDVKMVESNLVLEAKVKLNTPLLIKGISENKSEFADSIADSISVKKQNGSYYISGSSLKGVVRERVSEIVDYLGLPEEKVTLLFGSSAKEGSIGKIYFEDMDIKQPQDSVHYNRIHVDHFTAGVMLGAKFDAQPVMGKTTLRMKVKDISDDEDGQALIALLLLAFRDLVYGLYTLGGGYNVGFGNVCADEIYIIVDGQKIACGIHDEKNETTKRYMDALQRMRGGTKR